MKKLETEKKLDFLSDWKKLLELSKDRSFIISLIEKLKTTPSEILEKDKNAKFAIFWNRFNNDLVIKPNNTYLALLPIYMIKTTYKDKNYTYVINGDNCKLLGTLPISYFKIIAWFISLFDLFFIIGLIILLVIKGVMI